MVARRIDSPANRPATPLDRNMFLSPSRTEGDVFDTAALCGPVQGQQQSESAEDTSPSVAGQEGSERVEGGLCRLS